MDNIELLVLVVLIIILVSFLTVMVILVSTYLLTMADKKAPSITYENKGKMKNGDAENEVSTSLSVGDEQDSIE